MTVNDLLPCPFCAGKATVIKLKDMGVTIGCKGCGVNVGFYSKIEEAAETWNMRNGKKQKK